MGRLSRGRLENADKFEGTGRQATALTLTPDVEAHEPLRCRLPSAVFVKLHVPNEHGRTSSNMEHSLIMKSRSSWRGTPYDILSSYVGLLQQLATNGVYSIKRCEKGEEEWRRLDALSCVTKLCTNKDLAPCKSVATIEPRRQHNAQKCRGPHSELSLVVHPHRPR